jgi:hypothetical protein
LTELDCRVFAPTRTDYAELRSSDLNADGFDDVEAFLAGVSEPEVYYGSEHGLTTPVQMLGFPSSDGNDGKFASLTTQLPGSVGIPDYTFALTSFHDPAEANPALHLEIFDGDMAGSHDVISAAVASTFACFRLYADPELTEVASGEPLLTLSDVELSNDSWQSMLDLEDPAAQVEGVPGTFAYVLRAFLSTTGSCDGEPTYPTDPMANSFKVRANADVALASTEDPLIGLAGAFSILGSDSAGDFAIADDCTLDTCTTEFAQDVNTTYDGNWRFFVDVASGDGNSLLDQVTLADADADSLLDTVSPGSSSGASADTTFFAQDVENGNVLFQAPFPSGQYDADLEPCVAYTVTNGGAFLPGGFNWRWSSLFTHNNVWLAIPTDTPPQCNAAPAAAARLAAAATTADLVAPLLIRGDKPRRPVPKTTASTDEFWASRPARSDIARLLPIELGNDNCGCRDHAVTVHSTGQAQELLEQANRGSQKRRLMAQLRAQLLTAKLNIARGQSHGEHIERGFIYGTVQDIQSLLEDADAAVAHTCDADNGHGCSVKHDCGCHKGHSNHGWRGRGRGHDHDDECDPPLTDEDLAELIRLLSALNHGSVTYRAPISAAAKLTARSAAAARPSPISDFWKRF